MHWTFDSKAHNGLKIISEIPDISPCLLEGRNGVGKTVAIQLLELISGQIPEEFRLQPTLWSSLRERLGETSVSVAQLTDGHSLTVTFTPENWDATAPSGIGEWLGTATVDDQPSSVHECAGLLSVTRISGNEDLEETLRRRVAMLSATLQSAARIIRHRGEEIDAELGEVRTDLRRADPGEIESDTQRLSEIEEQLRRARDDAAASDRRLHRLLSALETKRHLDAAGQEAQELLTRREQLVSQVKRLDKELQGKEEQAKVADKAFSAEGDAQRKLSDAERLLRHRRSRLANLEREVEELARSLSMDVDTVKIRDELEKCGAQLRDLAARHRQLDATSLLRDLIGEIVVPLETAQSLAGDQILVKSKDGGLTVSQTFAGVTERRREISDQPQPAQLRELAALIDSANRRQDGLRELAGKVEQRIRQQGQVRQTANEAALAADQAEQASDAARESREANQAVGAAQEALTKAHAELAAVQQQIGSTGVASKEDALTDLREALAELGLGEAELAEAEGSARAALGQADRKLTDVAGEASAIRRRLTMRRTDIDLVIERMRESHRYLWLITGAPDLSASLADPALRYEAFGRFRTVVLQASESAFRAADFLISLVGTAESFFDHRVDPDGERELVQPLRPAFERLLGHRLRETLNRKSIREAIFDGSEVVRIEPRSRQLTLRDADGNESHRPMEAFSTGERAFAFTQARIADLEPPIQPNRLLVLDEFGAFVAADRLPDLASFLASDAQRVADQVVVILPLHVNYEAEIGDTRGELRHRYQDRLAQISERDYCAVTLE